jgi:hypothetical protein
MILQRLMHHLRAQNWFSVAVEIAIVLVGVFLGIEVSNWNEARQQRAAANEYVARIREDLAGNLRELETRSRYYLQVKAHGLRALEGFAQAPETLGAAFLRDTYEASQIIPRALGRGTYDEILSIGAVNWISDIELRKHLASYYVYADGVKGVMDFVPAYRENLRSHMPYAAQLAIVTQCPERIELGPGGASDATLAGDCVPDLPPALAAAAVAAIHRPEIERDLNRLVSDIDTKLGVYGRVSARARTLDAELAGRGY